MPFRPIMSEVFMLRNIPYTMGNARDFNIQLTKIVNCGHETITYKELQLWQQLPATLKK